MPLDKEKKEWCVINLMSTLRVHSRFALQRERHDWQGGRQMVCSDERFREVIKQPKKKAPSQDKISPHLLQWLPKELQ